MVSFVEILKRLMGGRYTTGFGYPGSDQDHEEFVRMVRERVPELRYKPDWEVDQMVDEALSWAINNICKPVDYRDEHDINYVKEGGLFACYHPKIGRFYIAYGEEQDGDAGVHHLGFIITRDRSEAEEYWRNTKSSLFESELR